MTETAASGRDAPMRAARHVLGVAFGWPTAAAVRQGRFFGIARRVLERAGVRKRQLRGST